jgi:hypothetical protein
MMAVAQRKVAVMSAGEMSVGAGDM